MDVLCSDYYFLAEAKDDDGEDEEYDDDWDKRNANSGQKERETRLSHTKTDGQHGASSNDIYKIRMSSDSSKISILYIPLNSFCKKSL